MATTLLTTGLLCVFAAIVGGGLQAFGAKVPIIESTRRQLVLSIFGVVLLIGAWVSSSSNGLKRPSTPESTPSPSTPASSTPDFSAAVKPAPQPQPIRYVSCTEIYSSKVADGWGINWSEPVVMCTPQKPDGWTIARVVSFYTTDWGTERDCSHWAHCTGQESDTATRICRTLTVQGHNDGSHEGHGKLQGHMAVEWRQPLKGDEDPNATCNNKTPIEVRNTFTRIADPVAVGN